MTFYLFHAVQAERQSLQFPMLQLAGVSLADQIVNRNIEIRFPHELLFPNQTPLHI